MRILLSFLAIPVLLGTACTPTARELEQQATAEAGTQAAIAREVAGLVPGRPQDCVTLTQVRESRTFGDTVIYRGVGGTRYVNRTGGGCGQASDAYLVTRTPGTQLCRGDIATAVDRTSQFPVGSCAFGEFVPYAPPRR